MFAVTAARFSSDDPLSALELGEHAEPVPPDGWTTVSVKAASLNHHDVWTLRGVGISADRLPMILGCDAAGVDADGNEVVVHGVVSGPGAAREPRSQAGGAVLHRSRLPAHGLSQRLPDAVRQVRRRAGEHGARPGSGRWRWAPIRRSRPERGCRSVSTP